MTFSRKSICFEAFFIAAGVWMLLAVAGCEVKNNNKTDCNLASCEAACAEQGYQAGACEENRCVCEGEGDGPYSFTDTDTDSDTDTDTDTDSDTDTDTDTDTDLDAGNFSPDSGAPDAEIQNL